MSRFQNYSDPDDNPGFRRDWGDGPVHIQFRSEISNPKKPTGKAARRTTISTPAPRPDVRAL